ncbi:Aldehyde/histidinol dehydrogenase [Aspergillus unguis]
MSQVQPFPRLAAAAIDGRTQNARYKQAQFHALQTALIAHIPEIKSALQTDSTLSSQEITAEICLALKELRAHYLSLSLEDDLQREYRIAEGKDNPDNARGVGMVYIVPGTHTMFASVVVALSAAIAGGNCIILELQKNTLTLPPLLKRILPEALDADTFAIAEERPDTTFLEQTLVVAQTEILPRPSQSLVSPSTARTIAVVDRTADIPTTAQSLVAGRFSFGGKSPYSPDLVLVQEFVLKALVEGILGTAPKYISGPEGEERGKISNNPRRASPGLSVLDQAYKDPSARVLVSGSDWGVVEVHDRASPLLKREGKIGEKVLLLHPVSSLDDAIDFANDFGTLAATYAFAAPDSAKYITQFIDAHLSFINHLPTDLLIGPAFPTNIPVPETLATRYTASSFQLPRPQFTTQSPTASLVQKILDNPASERTKAWTEAISPLPPTRQKNGPRIGFFEQGIITGGTITLTSFVAVVSTVGWYTISFLRR